VLNSDFRGFSGSNSNIFSGAVQVIARLIERLPPRHRDYSFRPGKGPNSLTSEYVIDVIEFSHLSCVVGAC